MHILHATIGGAKFKPITDKKGIPYRLGSKDEAEKYIKFCYPDIPSYERKIVETNHLVNVTAKTVFPVFTRNNRLI